MPEKIYNARFELADEETVRAYQLERLRELLLHTWSTNQFYRRRFREAGVGPDEIEQLQSLEEFAACIPGVAKPDFIRDQEENPPFGLRHVHALRQERPLFVCTTSGTSGQGQEVHMQTEAEMALTGETYSYALTWAGLQPGDQMFLTLPITMLGGGVIEYHAALHFGLTVHCVGNYDAERKMALTRRFKPQVILANTSYMGRLGSMIHPDERFEGLRCLITGAEGAGIAYLERLQETWHVPVYDRYGSTQAGNDHLFVCDQGVGTVARPGMMHNVDPWVLLEVRDPETGQHVADGEEGEFVVTSLYHFDTPLIRCRIGDWGTYHAPAYCACGRPFMGIEAGSIHRRDDMRKIKGVVVWPKAVNDAVFALAEVEEYQVSLTSGNDGADVATIRVMLSERTIPPDPDAFGKGLNNMLRERIGIRFEVELFQPGELDVGDWKASRWLDNRLQSTGR
jgi:phenylacetate-CoA ligase